MYLEKLEIQGFKSFANKNILVFPGMVSETKRGLTAIVGPNGSGKSNIADAVRWALGEQSMKMLRGKKSEDVIFSGSDKKGRLGMTEVSLYLNNQDRKAPLDYTQVVITRRLYRSGESEYLINSSRVRLSDIQMLLAKTNFGQKTYSVIGQGTVEGFLNTSLAERKEFFDEATGVKQFQIKRDESLNKLRSSYENLNQANMLLAEIKPRLKSLTRQVNKLNKRNQLEAELKEIQLNYYGKVWHEINNKFNQYNNKFLELEKIKLNKERKLVLLNKELKDIEVEVRTEEKIKPWQENLSQLQDEKDKIVSELARLNAALEIKLEVRGEFDLSWVNRKHEELSQERDKIKAQLQALDGAFLRESDSLKDLEEKRDKNIQKITELSQRLANFSQQPGVAEKEKVSAELQSLLSKLDKIKNEKNIKILREAVFEIRKQLGDMLEKFSRRQDQSQAVELKNKVAGFNKVNEELLEKINEKRVSVLAQKEKKKILQDRLEQIDRELYSLKAKLKPFQDKNNLEGLKNRKEKFKEQLAGIDKKIFSAKSELEKINKKEEAQRSRLFSLQKNIQSLQNEINEISGTLGELKVNSTRYETKLEDLEAEIRRGLGSLKEVKRKEVLGEVDLDEARAKISQLKHQLELIGGIDPEIEKEYIETKERYSFLSAQSEDLEKTIAALEKIIFELDETIKERFDKEFKRIQGKFNEYFKVLFNGGTAKIIKVMSEALEESSQKDEKNKLNNSESQDKSAGLKKIKFLKKHNATGLAGIEIQATPTGKKIKSISMLSGGERALTAIALICAIISANPSPFVVLDEVDAALDEANSERLAKILDDLSHKTQFIVITHNRASMRKANILYGVTMGDDGISKLLSVKLRDLKK